MDIAVTSSCTKDGPENDDVSGVVVFVCRSCRDADEPDLDPRPGSILAERAAEKAQNTGIEVRSVNCLANCKRGLSAVLRGADGWSYVFGGLTPDSAEDLLAGARLLTTAPDGLMPWRGRPDSLKRGMIARIPPFDFTEEMK